MEKKLILILLTHSFPDKLNEVFLWNELPYMTYDHIYIVPMSKPNKGILTIESPKFTVIQCGDTLKFPRGVLWWIVSFFKKSFWKEIKYVRKLGKLTFNEFAKILRATSYGERIIWTVNKNISFKDSDSLFAVYSYWLTSLAYAANKLKKQHTNCVISLSRCHGHDLYAYRYSNDYIEYQKQNLTEIDHLASISIDGLEYLRSRYGSNCCRDMFVSHLGTEDYGAQKYHKGVFTIVSCSRIVKLKRINLIIDALSDIDGFDVRWEHFGDGPYEKEIKNYAEEKLSHKSNITYFFHGYINNRELMDVYKSSSFDLFVNVSETEGIPVTVMEALSFGIPVVVTNVGGCSELVDDSCGVLLPKAFNISDLTKTFYCFHSMDQKKYDAMRNQARKKWESEFSAKHNYSGLHDMIQTNMLKQQYENVNYE